MAMDSSKQSTSRQGRSYQSSVDDSLDKILQEIEEKKKIAAGKERIVPLLGKRTFELKPRPSLVGRMFEKLNNSQDENAKNNELTPPNLNTTKITSPKNPEQLLKAPIPLPRTMQNQNFIASTPYGDKKNVFENNSTVFSPISKTHRFNKEQKINNVRKSRLGEASGLQRTKSLSPRRSIFTKTTRSKSSTEIVVIENNVIEKVNESLNKKSPNKSNNESIKNNKNNSNLSVNSDKKNENNKSIINKDKNKSVSAKSPKLAENSTNDLKKRGRPKKINSTQNVSIQTSLKRKSEESELNDSFTKKSKKNATIQTSVEKASALKANDSNKENINKLLSCLKDRSIDYILDENQRRNTGIKQIRVHSQKSICQKKARNLQSKRRASTGSNCFSDTDPSRSIDVDAANRKKSNLKRAKFVRRRPSDSEQSSSSELASAFSLYAGDYHKPDDGNKSNLKKSASQSDYLFKSLPPPAESGSCAFTTLDNPDGIGDEKSTGKPWRCSSLTKEEYLDVLKLSPKCHQTPTSPKSVSFVASQTRSKKDMSLSPTSANQLTPKSILKSPTATSTTAGVRKISSARKSIVFEDSPDESPKSVARGRPKKSLSLQRINRSPSKSSEKIDKSNSSEAERRVVILNDVMVQPATKPAKNSSKIRNQSRDREMSVENVRVETPPKKARNNSKNRKDNERDLEKSSNNSRIGENTLSKAIKTSPGRPKRVRKQRQFISYDLDVLRLDINQILQQKEALTKPAKKRKPAKKSVKEQNSSIPSDSEQSTSKKSVKKSNLPTKSKKLKTSLNTSRTKIVFDSSPKIKKRRGRPPKKASVLEENETNNNNLNNMQMDSGLPSSNFSLSNNDHLNTNTNSTSFKSPVIDRKIVNNKEKSSPKIASPIAGPSTSDLIFKKPKTPISRSKIKENSSNISKNSNQSSSLLVKKSRGRPRKKPLLESVSDLQNSISSAWERSRNSSLSPENNRLKFLINSAKENRVEKKSLINTIFKVSPRKTKTLDKLDHSMTILVMNGEGTLHKDKESISIKRTQFLHVPPKTKVSLEANDENLELFYFILSNP